MRGLVQLRDELGATRGVSRKRRTRRRRSLSRFKSRRRLSRLLAGTASLCQRRRRVPTRTMRCRRRVGAVSALRRASASWHLAHSVRSHCGVMGRSAQQPLWLPQTVLACSPPRVVSSAHTDDIGTRSPSAQQRIEWCGYLSFTIPSKAWPELILMARGLTGGVLTVSTRTRATRSQTNSFDHTTSSDVQAAEMYSL